MKTQSWWGKAFIDALEAGGSDGRLQRGRAYARTGRVLDLQIGPGRIDSFVQGNATKGYRVRVSLPRWDGDQIEEFAAALAKEPYLVAAVFGGTLPPELETLAADCGVDLLPSAASLLYSCTCPDWGQPCKHAAATTYLAAAELDRDPWTLFTLRGTSRDGFVQRVLASSTGRPAGQDPSADPVQALAPVPELVWDKPGTALDELGPHPSLPGIQMWLSPLYEAMTRRR